MAQSNNVGPTIADRNASHAAMVRRMLQAHRGGARELSFAALEECEVDLSEVVRLCDEHDILFEQFASFNELLFGSDELNDLEEAHEKELQAARDADAQREQEAKTPKAGNGDTADAAAVTAPTEEVPVKQDSSAESADSSGQASLF